MEYSLNFRIEGLVEANQQLKEMLQLLAQVSAGKFSFSGGSASGIGAHAGGGVQIISPQQLQNLERASRGMQNIKKEVQSLATASAQGFGSQTMKFLTNLPPDKLARTLADNPDLKKAWESMKSGGAGGLPTDEKARREKMRQMRDTAQFMKDMTFGMMPVMNPGSPWGTLFATRQIFSALMTQHGQGLLGKFGMGGTTGAGLAAGGIVAGLTAVGAGLMAFRKAIEGAKSAIQQAFGLYTGAAQSGISTQYYTRRQALAGIFGIQGNPNQVFLFGKAVAEVEKQTSTATNILSKNARVLAETEINVKILTLDFQALYSEIAVKLAPAIERFVQNLHSMFLSFERLESISQKLNKLDPAFWLFKGLTHIYSKIGQSPDAAKLPALTPYMKQLPVSSWEKMGLQIGGGSEMLNYTKQIARNTARMANALTGGGNRSTGMPSFVMNNP